MLQNTDTQESLFFPDETTFCLHRLVNKHNIICGYEMNPLVTIESIMKSPKLNVWCAISKDQLIGPFFFEAHTVNEENNLPILQNNFLFQRFGNDTNFNLLYFNKMVLLRTSLSMYDIISRQSFS